MDDANLNKFKKSNKYRYKYIMKSKEVGSGISGTVCKCMIILCPVNVPTGKDDLYKEAGCLGTQREVAAKIIPVNSEALNKEGLPCLKEIDIMTRMSHRNLVRCFDFHLPDEDKKHSQTYMIFMELGECTLTTYLKNRLPSSSSLSPISPSSPSSLLSSTPLSLGKKISIITQICNGLKYIHDNHILHLDIKPQNIIMMGDVPKIADFGSSCYAHPQRGKQMDKHLGSRPYSAPEILDGDDYYTAKSDVWSMGVVIYYILNGGSIPWTGENVKKHLSSIFNNSSKKAHLTNLVKVAMEGSQTYSNVSSVVYSRRLTRVLDIMLEVSIKDRCYIEDALDILLSIYPDQDVVGSIGNISLADMQRRDDGKMEDHVQRRETIATIKEISITEDGREVKYIAESVIADKYLSSARKFIHFFYDRIEDILVEEVFLAVDIYYRYLCVEDIKDSQMDVLFFTCLSISSRLVTGHFLPRDIMRDMRKESDNNSLFLSPRNVRIEKEISDLEYSIIRCLDAVMYRPYIFHRCRGLKDIAFSYVILFRDDYMTMNMDNWFDVLREKPDIGNRDVCMSAIWRTIRDI